MKVRRGGYPSHVNILATKAQNSDIYIQSVAVAAIAAEKISLGDNCVTPVPQTVKPTVTIKDEPTRPTTPGPDKGSTKKNKNGLGKKLLDGFKNIFKEDGEEDEDDNF